MSDNETIVADTTVLLDMRKPSTARDVTKEGSSRLSVRLGDRGRCKAQPLQHSGPTSSAGLPPRRALIGALGGR